jgi:2,3-bisphosphoglycerate-independent phosphoglycerate mutase
MSKGRGPKGPVVLIVLDGWGYRPGRDGNAIELGETPTWHALWAKAPRALLEASGRAVGLPEGQMGNSEVGHLNLGAGRVVPQDIVRISDSVASGAFFELPVLVDLCRAARQSGGTLHLLGLLGSGGVHALDRHLEACIELGRRQAVPRIAVHAFLDGRDTPPTSARQFMEELGEYIRRTDGPTDGRTVIATVVGRYYAMDRDKRWDRTEKAYAAMVRGQGHAITDPVQGIADAYQRGETDEFIKPLVVQRDGKPVAPIKSGDAVFCFNFRADRMRQIVRALAIEGFDGFDVRDRPAVRISTLTQYDATFPIPVAFEPMVLARIVAEVLADRGRTTFRTAETEKYAHVTYFFNGGLEAPYTGEERLLVPSQKVATYDLKPEMSAPGVTDVLCKAIEARGHDFVLCNYANGDMVGHTGVLPAAIKAVETVDQCLVRVLKSAEQAKATVLITADHGNCEMMIDPATGGPHTAHTSNVVPLVLVSPNSSKVRLRAGGALCDVGPTVFGLLGVEPPAEMTGTDLREGA